MKQMKHSRNTWRFGLAVMVVLMLATAQLPLQAQTSNGPTPVNGAAPSAAGPAGTVTNPASNGNIAVSPGPVYCNGSANYIHNTTFTLTLSNTWYVAYNCPTDRLYANLFPPPSTDYLLATVVCNATACSNGGNGSVTDNRLALMFPNESDESFFVPASQCGGGVTGTAGAGNATDIVALSGGMRVFRLSNTAAGASNNTFTCVFSVPTKLTAGKGFTITDITFLVSTQTTQPTSVVLPTLKSATVPAATDPETANSATFVTFGGTITVSPSSAQFAAYTPVAAGQFFSYKAILGTPVVTNTDLQVYQFVIQFNQSAAAAGVQETPGFIVHGTRVAL